MTGVNVLAYRRGNEFYLFGFTDERCDAMAETLYRFARDPDLAFTLRDASELGERVREREMRSRNRLSLEE